MGIVMIFEQLAKTIHYKVNFNELLKEESIELQQIFKNNDASSLKTLFNEKEVLADRTKIFDL